jgi:hypothetical protein
MPKRSINHSYQDPVDLIWLRAAADLGLTVQRSRDAYAAYDGQGHLTISVPDEFDPDDSLAQMIFHELCHWLVSGPGARDLPDWGLSNTSRRDLVYEYACHRLQAALAAPYGLREFMAVTTVWRSYWNALPENPLQDGEDPAIAIAQAGFRLARTSPFQEVLSRSLAATAAIADAVRGVVPESSLWSTTRARHRLGSLLSTSDSQTCGTCAWAITSRSGLRCRQHKLPGNSAPAVQGTERACERWEPQFTADDCGSCGACCRQGFDFVQVSSRDPFVSLHPELVQLKDGRGIVPRPDGLCVALNGDGSADTPFRCRHYETRPKNCRDFEVAGDACLQARRRVGLTR